LIVVAVNTVSSRNRYSGESGQCAQFCDLRYRPCGPTLFVAHRLAATGCGTSEAKRAEAVAEPCLMAYYWQAVSRTVIDCALQR
jgi:hypothetical protein